jgi:hypothetical protein
MNNELEDIWKVAALQLSNKIQKLYYTNELARRNILRLSNITSI